MVICFDHFTLISLAGLKSWKIAANEHWDGHSVWGSNASKQKRAILIINEDVSNAKNETIWF